jgi:hypothetical protein
MTTKVGHKAADAVLARLAQMRQLWDDAANAYFDPQRFLLSLQNAIAVSRTVTFILQSNKHEISDFDAWYSSFQDKWRQNPVMVWAREARNAIEKRGDLEGSSQVRATIIASYVEGPETGWLSQALFASPAEIYGSVPRRYFIPHVLQNGTILIERRWVDSTLPDVEVLEALALVYGELCDLAQDLLERLSLPIPDDLLHRPNPTALAMDRAIYLSMKNGSTYGFRYFERPLPGYDTKWRSRAARRYGVASLKRLRQATTFREIAEGFFEIGRAVLLRDGHHDAFAVFLKGNAIKRVVPTPFPDRAAKYVIMRDLALLARADGADGVLTIGEAWTASSKDIPKSGFAAEARNRGEALMMSAANALGESFSLQASFTRKKLRRSKVKSINATQFIGDAFELSLYPFMKEWDCVDEARLAKSLAALDEMGIETPHIPPG